MPLDVLATPLTWLSAALGPNLPDGAACAAYEQWWQERGEEGASHDSQAVTEEGYNAGVLWRYFTQETLLPCYSLGYIAAFYNAGTARVYAHSLVTAHLVDKYAPPDIRARYLPHFNGSSAHWSGTVFPGFSRSASLVARRSGNSWWLSGELSAQPSSAAHLAVVPALLDDRPDKHGLFLVGDVPLTRAFDVKDRLLQDVQAVLLGEIELYEDLAAEARNLLRAGESLRSVAVTQRALAEMSRRLARADTRETEYGHLEALFALAWEAAELANWTCRETAWLRSDTYRLFEWIAFLASNFARERGTERIAALGEAADTQPGERRASGLTGQEDVGAPRGPLPLDTLLERLGDDSDGALQAASAAAHDVERVDTQAPIARLLGETLARRLRATRSLVR